MENNHFLSSDHLHNITEVAIHRLEQQLGKPYVWGGTRPDQGFDCSGLVFYAYNKILEAKLPRTANEMYHYRRATSKASIGALRPPISRVRATIWVCAAPVSMP